MNKEDQRLTTVGALLEKARSTSYAGEHEALTVRAYSLLASYLNSIEPVGSGGARKRERRLLRDRRQNWNEERPQRSGGQDAPVDPDPLRGAVAAYRGSADRRPMVGLSLDVAL